MESVRQAMYLVIERHGVSSLEALEASQELDKHIVKLQRPLTKAEFMAKVVNDLNKKKQAAKNEADLYLWDKGRMVGRKAVKHKQRQPYWRAK